MVTLNIMVASDLHQMCSRFTGNLRFAAAGHIPSQKTFLSTVQSNFFVKHLQLSCRNYAHSQLKKHVFFETHENLKSSAHFGGKRICYL